MHTASRAKCAIALALLLLQPHDTAAVTPSFRRIGLAEPALGLVQIGESASRPAPGLAQIGESASRLDKARKRDGLRALYRRDPVMFLRALDRKLARKLAAVRTGGGPAPARDDAPQYPFEPLLDVDFILDADNYLEDFIDAPGIPEALAARYTGQPTPVAEVAAPAEDVPTTPSPTTAAPAAEGTTTPCPTPCPPCPTAANSTAADFLAGGAGLTTSGDLVALAAKIEALRAEVQSALEAIHDGTAPAKVSAGSLKGALRALESSQPHDAVSFQQLAAQILKAPPPRCPSDLRVDARHAGEGGRCPH